MLLTLTCAIFLSATFAPTEAGKLLMRRNMDREKIVPDMVDNLPAHILTIKYGPGTVVHAGNELTPTSVKDMPTQVKWSSENGSLYTLIMADLDAPSRADPKDREGLHW